jgi:hypothetical protein
MTVNGLMAAVAAVLRPRLTAIEERVAALESRPRGIVYQGVWAELKSYDAGDVVTHAGSAWIALQATRAKPGDAGQASRSWQLMVKRGRDAR